MEDGSEAEAQSGETELIQTPLIDPSLTCTFSPLMSGRQLPTLFAIPELLPRLFSSALFSGREVARAWMLAPHQTPVTCFRDLGSLFGRRS